MKISKASAIKYFFVFAVIASMTAAADISGEKEIIFPEIAAIAIGAVLPAKQTWNASPVRIFLSITALSWLGLCISLLSFKLYFSLPLALFCGLAGVLVSHTGFYPQISACVLPVMLGTDSIIYPVSAMLFTLIILIVQKLMIDSGPISKREYLYTPINRERILFFSAQFIIVSLLIVIAVLSKQLFFIAPPLIVAYMELVSPASKVRIKWKTLLLLIAISAFSGSALRFFFSEKLGLPLTLTLLSALIIPVFVMHMTKTFFPPAGAVCALSLLVDSDKLFLYPFDVVAGFSILLLISFVFARVNKKFYTVSAGETEYTINISE